MFETSSAPQLLVHEARGVIADVNPAAVRLYGWPREAMTAMHFTDLGTPETWNAPLRTRHRTARGEWREVELHSAALDADGVMFRHVIVHTLPAPAVRANAAGPDTSAVRSVASEPLQDLRSVARRVGHDLNNVLTVVRGAAMFLQDVVQPGSQASEDLASIERAADRAEALTEELRRVAGDAALQQDLL